MTPDQMSDDIKTLEQYLRKCGLGGMPASSGKVSWSGKRILYGDKPLIEVPLAERWEGFEMLPALLTEIAEKIKQFLKQFEEAV